jgi:hypothetical protein
MSADEQPLETLRCTYERLCHERDRLRDARGFFARSLAPAQASAGVGTALVAAVGENPNAVGMGAAVALLLAMVYVGFHYDGKAAYRHLYAERIKALREAIVARNSELSGAEFKWPGEQPEDRLPSAEWYRAMIRLERDIYGEPRSDTRKIRPRDPVRTLQDGLDVEWAGRRRIQALWVGVVIALGVALAI